MRKIVTAAVAASALFATQAMAQDYGNIYIGLGFGTTELDTTISIPGSGNPSANLKGDTETYSGILGYAFNEFISIEGVITVTGKAGASQWAACRDTFQDPDDCGSQIDPDANPPATGINGIEGSTDMRAFELAAKGTLPLGNFELYGRAGWIFGDFNYDYRFYNPDAAYGDLDGDDEVITTTNVTRIVNSNQDNGLLVGIGLGWNIGRGAIRLQYDYMGIEASETSNYIINGSDTSSGTPIFSQTPTDVTIKTDKPSRLMLAFTGRF